MGPETVRRVAPLAVAALVLAVIAVLWGVLRADPGSSGNDTGAGGSGSAEPAPLHLSGWQPAGSDLPDPRYRLAPGADLPDHPASARVYRLAAGVAPDDPSLSRLPVPVGTAEAPDLRLPSWLPATEPTPAYPLVTARQAYQALRRTPLPMPLIACPDPLPAGMDPVTCGGPLTVTGARLGLARFDADAGPLLVPSWLFSVEDSANPLVQVAVAPRLLATGTGGGDPVPIPDSTGQATKPVLPTASATAAPGSRITRVVRTGDGLRVTFWGGVPQCYSYQVRAVETEQAVHLRVVEHRSPADTVCIDLAMEIDRSVPLGKPLGLRRVVDAESGQVLLGPSR